MTFTESHTIDQASTFGNMGTDQEHLCAIIHNNIKSWKKHYHKERLHFPGDDEVQRIAYI